MWSPWTVSPVSPAGPWTPKETRLPRPSPSEYGCRYCRASGVVAISRSWMVSPMTNDASQCGTGGETAERTRTWLRYRSLSSTRRWQIRSFPSSSSLHFAAANTQKGTKQGASTSGSGPLGHPHVSLQRPSPLSPHLGTARRSNSHQGNRRHPAWGNRWSRCTRAWWCSGNLWTGRIKDSWLPYLVPPPRLEERCSSCWAGTTGRGREQNPQGGSEVGISCHSQSAVPNTTIARQLI